MKFNIILVLLALASLGQAARILFIGCVGTRSHKNSFMPVIKELGQRGHSVTFMTHAKSKKPSENVTEIVIEELLPYLNSVLPDDVFESNTEGGSSMFSLFHMFKSLMVHGCEYVLEHKYVKDLLAGKVLKPDLLIASITAQECALGIAYRLKIPFIYFNPGTHMPWTISSLRIPNDPTYCPQSSGHSTDRMNFWERLQNVVTMTTLTLVRKYSWEPAIHEVMKKHYGDDIPSFMDIEKNCSLIILNSHFSMDYPRPATPHLIEAGGMHVKPSVPLPQDLETWVSESGEHGVVYFSLGSAFPSSKMPLKYRQMFIEAFSRIPQKVLWKWEKDEEPEVSSNVRFSKWVPQNDLLGHPNIRVFITHGGLLSTMETTFHGVPVLGIPIAVDQTMNMKNTAASGAGIMLTWNTLSADKIVDALHELINNKDFSERVKYRAAVAKDRDVKPLEKVIYWIEYVIRHKGAHHLRPGSVYLSDFQYYMIDIYLALHVAVAFLVATVFGISYWLLRRLCKSKQKLE